MILVNRYESYCPECDTFWTPPKDHCPCHAVRTRPRNQGPDPMTDVRCDPPIAAAEKLRENAKALDECMKSFDDHVREEQFWGRYGLEAQIADLFQLVGRVAYSVKAGLETMADTLPPPPYQEK